MEDLQVAIVQPTLHWEDSEANRAHFSTLFTQVPDGTDLVVLPEMFTTGFSMAPERLAEETEGPTWAWMKAEASRLQATVVGSFIAQEGGNYFNRLVWMEPTGDYRTYDKRHLFSLAKEEDHYTAGKERWVDTCKGWRIFPLICYDLRFPVWCRNDLGYDAILFVANWPERRRYPWKQLLLARAIENQAYVIGVNRVGPDGNGVMHSGDSAVIDPLGAYVAEATEFQEEVVIATLSREHLDRTRTKFQFLADRDSFRMDM